jgi:tetrapyrrole methylase family protein/MazG family protein
LGTRHANFAWRVLLFEEGIMSQSNPKPTPGEAFSRLADIIARLRAPDGCPWDREQTHTTLRTHLLEEACETMDAIDLGDAAHLCEELGDLLLQPVLHAQIAQDENNFDIVDVLEGISDKLVRRHPHVFGEITVADSGEVLTNWDAIKREEKAKKGRSEDSILSGVPNTLPALSQAMEISKKAAKAGFEWPNMGGVLAKLREELDELEVELADETLSEDAARERVAEELGDLLFTAVNIARWRKVDPELALRDTVRRFRARFEAIEAAAREQNTKLEDLSLEQWDELWEIAKRKQSDKRVSE